MLCFGVDFWAFRMAICESSVLSCDPSKGQLRLKFSKSGDIINDAKVFGKMFDVFLT